MPFATVADRRIHYVDTGGDGPVVVFSHGNLMDAQMWRHQWEGLGSSARCIAWDARLHGRTEDDGAPYSYWDAAGDLLGLLDVLGIEQAILVGHSQGGFISMRAALTAPQRVSGLVLVDTTAMAWPPERLAQMSRVRDGFRDAGPEAVAPTLLPMLLAAPDLHDERLALWRKQSRDRLGTAVEVLMSVDDLRDRLAEITAPAAIVHGAQDQPVPLAAGLALHEGLPNTIGAPTIIPAAGHTPPLTHPEAVTRAIAAAVGYVFGRPPRVEGLALSSPSH